MEVSDLGILVRAMHCAAHDGFTLAAASSIILEVKLCHCFGLTFIMI